MGWRFWQLVWGRSRAYLMSPLAAGTLAGVPMILPDSGFVTTWCAEGHTSPRIDCSCGLYFYPTQFRGQLPGHFTDGREMAFTYGAAAGRIRKDPKPPGHRFERGYRAETFQADAILTPRGGVALTQYSARIYEGPLTLENIKEVERIEKDNVCNSASSEVIQLPSYSSFKHKYGR